MSREEMDTYVERQRRQATADAAALPSGKRSPSMNVNVIGEGTAALNGLELGERVLRFGPIQPASYANVMHAEVAAVDFVDARPLTT